MLSFIKKKYQDPKKILQEVLRGYELPSFPNVVISVMRMLRDPSTPMPSIAAHLQKDPGMSVRVLRMVNSAAFGLPRNVSNVRQAVTLLGRSRVEALVVSVAVKQAMPRNSADGFDGNQFWLTSARRASVARALAQHLHPAHATEAFTAGLLQDMAVPILVQAHKDRYCDLYKRYQQDAEADLIALEREVLGFDHAAVGAIIAKEWQLPVYLATAIGGHHGVEAAVHPAIRLVALVRDSEAHDGKDQLIQTCREGFGMAEDPLYDLLKQAYSDAEVFHQQGA